MADNEEIALSQAILLVAICNNNTSEELKIKPFEFKTDGIDSLITFLGNVVWYQATDGIPQADRIQQKAIYIGGCLGISKEFIKALFRVPM